MVQATYFQLVGESGWDFQGVLSNRKDFASTGIWGSFGVDKRGGANRDSRVEPALKLITDGWTVDAKQLKNRRVADTK